MICEVCSAPSLPLESACVFCRAPLEEQRAGGAELLDYLAERVASARARRGMFRRGPVRKLELEAGGERFSARFRNEQLNLRPELEPALWVDRLLAGLSRDAASDAGLRNAMTRAGWRLR